MSLLELFCAVDDFWQGCQPIWEQQQLESGLRQRLRTTRLSESEIMTILIQFHSSRFRDFKAYDAFVRTHQATEFPTLVSYERFVQLIPRVGVPLYVYLRLCQGQCTGISFVDSTPLHVCHNKRIEQHRVFDGFAERGKTTRGWFFGFKLHSVINHHGELVAFDLTPGNIDDRTPLDQFQSHLFGKLFGDKGYLSQPLFKQLLEQHVQLVSGIRSNIKPRLMPLWDKLMLRKRSLIETINDQLKNVAPIEHSRHRSVNNFFVHLLAGLTAYCHQPKKPSTNWAPSQRLALHLLPT